jgi:hypothetical protein
VGLAVEDWKRYTLAQGNIEDHMRLALDAETE